MARIGRHKKKNINVEEEGKVYIVATANKLTISLTNKAGNVISWSSTAKRGSLPDIKTGKIASAQSTAMEAAQVAYNAGMRNAQVYIKGTNKQLKKAAIAGVESSGIEISKETQVKIVPSNRTRRDRKRVSPFRNTFLRKPLTIEDNLNLPIAKVRVSDAQPLIGDSIKVALTDDAVDVVKMVGPHPLVFPIQPANPKTFGFKHFRLKAAVAEPILAVSKSKAEVIATESIRTYKIVEYTLYGFILNIDEKNNFITIESFEKLKNGKTTPLSIYTYSIINFQDILTEIDELDHIILEIEASTNRDTIHKLTPLLPTKKQIAEIDEILLDL